MHIVNYRVGADIICPKKTYVNKRADTIRPYFQSKNKKHTLTPRPTDIFLAFNYIKYMCCACAALWAA